MLCSGASWCPVLWLKVSGKTLPVVTGTKQLLKLKAANMLRSSTYFKFSELGLGMDGLRRAPLKIIMKSKIPKKAPWGEDPGRLLLEDMEPLYLMKMDHSVR